MPVSADTVQFSYLGDGSTTVFPFPSRFLSNTDIIVGVAGAQVFTGFTVTGAGAEVGGNVTFTLAPLNGQVVTLIRAPAINQLLDFVNNQTVLAENIDNGLDKLTIIAQFLEYLLDRTIRLSQFDTTLSGNYDLMTKRIVNSGAPVDANDLARLVDLQNVVSADGNVPSPTAGQIGYRLQALAEGIFGWVAAGLTSAPDGSLAAPGISFANELNTGFLRPSAGVLQTSVLGGLRTELSSTALRLLVSLLSTNGTVVGGTNAQGQGPITTDQATVTSTPNNPSGVTLPTAVEGRRVIVANRGTNPINLYPASGANIGALAVNLPVALAVGQTVEFFARTTTQWEGQISQPLGPTLTSLEGLSLAAGDILYATAPDTLAKLAAGAEGTALTVISGVPAYANVRPPVRGNFFLGATAGTYSRTGTLITVTMTAHGMATGQFCYLDFTTGAGTDDYYQITSTGANTFTVVDAASGATSGNVTRQGWVRSSTGVSSFRRNSLGRFTVTFTTAFADANYTVLLTTGSASEFGSFTAAGFVSAPTTANLTGYVGTHGATSAPTAVDMDFLNLVIFT